MLALTDEYLKNLIVQEEKIFFFLAKLKWLLSTMGSITQNYIFHTDFASFKAKNEKYLISVGLNNLIYCKISQVHQQTS